MSLRIGIVGAGANTRERHIPGFQEIDGVEVAAVCNRSRESGQRAADDFGIPTVYDDWKEVVHAADVDAVCIGTWPYLHCAITLECLAAGKHVLTEARMAMNLDEARRMLAAARASDRVSMIVPAPINLESEPTLLDMVAAGDFGASCGGRHCSAARRADERTGCDGCGRGASHGGSRHRGAGDTAAAGRHGCAGAASHGLASPGGGSRDRCR